MKYKLSVSVAICQDIDTLLAVREFTFDLTDKDFVRYYVSRTGDRINESGNGPYMAKVICTEDEWQEFCADINNPPDIVWRIRRAKMQNCWEIYCAYELPALPQADAA